MQHSVVVQIRYASSHFVSEGFVELPVLNKIEKHVIDDGLMDLIRWI